MKNVSRDNYDKDSGVVFGIVLVIGLYFVVRYMWEAIDLLLNQ